MSLRRDRILVDTGVLFGFYDSKDDYHEICKQFLLSCTGELITTAICIAEVVWLLRSGRRTQNELLTHLSKRIYTTEPLTAEDFRRIAELNDQYSDLPGDFADLALVSISERLDIADIATVDSDFDVYRRYRKQPFNRVFYP